MPNKIKTYFGKFGLNQNDLIQGSNSAFADDCKNVQSRDDNGLEKRKGYQIKTPTQGGYGLVQYKYVKSDNTVVTELLIIDDSLYRLVEGTFAIAYTGSQPHAVVKVTVSSAELVLTLIENNATILSQSLGQGYDESSTEALSDTKTAVDAKTGFAATITGEVTTPSAFLDVTPELIIPSGQTKSIKFLYKQEVNTTITKPLDNLDSLKSTDDLKNIQAINHKNILVLTDGGYPKVYDGQTVYKAGLPKPQQLLYYLINHGPLTNTFTYYITYEYTDARGKRTESSLPVGVEIIATTNSISLNVETLNKDSGYNTNCSIINGDQTVSVSSGTVTLNVDSTKHTLKAGDSALLKNRDKVGNPLTTYEVDSVGASTLVLTSSETIRVLDADVVSNNLRLNIYREDGVSTIKNLVIEEPNNSFVNSIQIEDGNTRANVVGNQTLTQDSIGKITILIDDGSGNDHDIAVSSTISLLNRLSTINDYRIYNVLEITSNSIIIQADEDVTVNDNDDIKVSASLATFTSYIRTQGPPPKADFCASYKDNLVLAKGQTVYWSDEINNGTITSGLSFPASDNFMLFPNTITALGITGEVLVIFSKKSINGIIGRTLDLDIINRFLITDHIGCSSWSSITPIGDILLFVSESGIYGISKGRLISNNAGIPVPISKNITPFFKEIKESGTPRLELKRSVGINDFKQERFLLFIPSELSTNVDYSDKQSVILVYEYAKDNWFFWKDINMAGGAVVDDDGNLYWTERSIGPSLGRKTIKRLNLKTSDDYYDHSVAIDSMYEFKWDSLDFESLSTYKKPLNLKLYSVRQKAEDDIHNPTITIDTYKDFVNDLLHSSSSFSFGTAGNKWPFRWDDRPIGNWREPFTKKRMSSELLEVMKLKIINNEAGVNFNISGLEIEWNSPYDKQLKT